MFCKKVSVQAIACAGLLVAASACSSDDGGGKAEPSGSIEIFSWWISGGEVDALNALLAVQKEKYPKTQVKNVAEDLAEEARARLEQRMAEGAPPSTFQANIGGDLFKWVLFNGRDDSESKLEVLDQVAEQNGWFRSLPPALLESLSYDGRMYGVPANIHRLNSLFYNLHVFESAGLQPPKTLAELKSVSATLQANGFTPLCIGSEHWWTLELLAFEAILPAVAGADYYERYWTGKETPSSSEMKSTLQYLRELWPYFNEDADSLAWTDGIDLLFRSQRTCAMTVMGDWAKGYLQTKGKVPGVDFGQVPFPGTSDTYVFTSDCFPLPKGAPNRQGTLSLLKTIGSVEAQVAFNAVKGSIPARTDVDPALLDAMQQRSVADFAASTVVRARSGLLPAGSFGDVGPALQDMLAAPDNTDEGVINALVNDYSAVR